MALTQVTDRLHLMSPTSELILVAHTTCGHLCAFFIAIWVEASPLQNMLCQLTLEDKLTVRCVHHANDWGPADVRTSSVISSGQHQGHVPLCVYNTQPNLALICAQSVTPHTVVSKEKWRHTFTQRLDVRYLHIQKTLFMFSFLFIHHWFIKQIFIRNLWCRDTVWWKYKQGLHLHWDYFLYYDSVKCHQEECKVSRGQGRDR